MEDIAGLDHNTRTASGTVMSKAHMELSAPVGSSIPDMIIKALIQIYQFQFQPKNLFRLWMRISQAIFWYGLLLLDALYLTVDRTTLWRILRV
jgi:hypothetical protein